MDYTKDLHELCETLSEAIREANEKIRAGGGKLNAGDTTYIDQLTHALKSVKATIAMMENEDEGYSGHYPYYMGGSYDDGGMGGNRSMRGRSYAQRRDSRGRYSNTYNRDGYSRDGSMVEELRELMQDAPDDRTRQEFQRFITKIESM